VTELSIFLSGATAMACVAIGVFFLRFWRRTDDRLFAIFAVAFWVFAANRVALLLVDEDSESARVGIYGLRALAFALIIAAIVGKNRRDAAA
jgi:hypothetical protein